MSCLPNLDKVILKYPNWQPLGINIRRLDVSTDTEPEAVIDRSKAMFETVSKTLLSRLGENSATLESLDVVGLRQKLLDRLGLGATDEKIIKNFIDILAAGRNSEGIIGHGRDIARESEIRSSVNKNRNEFIISILDSCLCYMIEIVEFNNQQPEVVETESYTNNEDYNALIDADETDVEIRGVIYRKSELLFYADRQNYLDGLQEYNDKATADE